MNNLTMPHHFGPEKMPDVSSELSDDRYREVQNNIVIGCTDVLIYDRGTGEVLSGYRNQKPQEGYWFSCGGRIKKRGQSPQDAAASKIKEELGLEIDPHRLDIFSAQSTAFDERQQEPQGEGVHTLNIDLSLGITPEERTQMELTLNREHSKIGWFRIEDILKGDEFPPALKAAVKDLDHYILLRALHAAR